MCFFFCTAPRSKDTKSSDSSSSSKPRKRPVRNISTPTNVSPAKKLRPNAGLHQGRDYDLNEIRSELKGFNTVKTEPEEIKQELPEKESDPSPTPIADAPTEPSSAKRKEEDVYEFKEPEPFELELHDEKKKRTHRIFDDISPSKYTAALSKSLSEEINEDPMKPRTTSLRSPSLSPYRDFAGTSGIGKQSPPEDPDSKDDLFSLDGDSFQGDGSSGPTFEGFIPAKNQETYSKKSKVSKLKQLIDDSPDSPADDEQSSDDSEDIAMKDDDDASKSASPTTGSAEESKSSSSSVQDEPKAMDEDESEIKEETGNISPTAMMIDLQNIPKPPNTPPPLQNIDIPMKIEVPKKIEIPKKSEQLKKPEPFNKTEPPKKIESQKKVEVLKKTDTPKKLELPKKGEGPKKIELPKKVEPPKKEPFKKVEPSKKSEQPKKAETTPKKVEPLKKLEVPKRLEIIKKIEIVKKSDSPKKVELLEKEFPKKVELRNIEFPKTTIAPAIASTSILAAAKEKTSEEIKEDKLKLLSIPLPASDPIKLTPKKLDPEQFKTKMEPPSSPIIDGEEDKSEPDSPARIDVIPEPPPAFLLQSEGPKIAEKLLKAISSAKRLSMSPPPVDNRTSPVTSKMDTSETKLSPICPEPRTSITKTEPVKPLVKITEPKKEDSVFGEPSNIMDGKMVSLDVKKREGSLTPRLQSPLNILERRKSVAADLPLNVVAGKTNKVLSDTIQKLSSQINQSAAAASVANIPLPSSTTPFLSEDRSESSDSDDSSRR